MGDIFEISLIIILMLALIAVGTILVSTLITKEEFKKLLDGINRILPWKGKRIKLILLFLCLIIIPFRLFPIVVAIISLKLIIDKLPNDEHVLNKIISLFL